MLSIGNPAPAFDLRDQYGKRVRSSALKGRRYVLFFYPKDDTPGCTREACAFRDHMSVFEQGKVPVFGVSGDTVPAHAKFSTKYGLNFPLLADIELKLIKAYGVWVEKSLYGRKYMGIARVSFVIDADGHIEKVWDKVKPDVHAQEVETYLRAASIPTTVSAIETRSSKTTKTKASVASATKPAMNKAEQTKNTLKPVAKRSTAKKAATTKSSSANKTSASRRTSASKKSAKDVTPH